MHEQNTATSRERERMDDMLMAVDEVGHLRFVAPRECKSDDGRSPHYGGERTPGIYLQDGRGGASPVAYPTFKGRLLKPGEATEYAALLDALASSVRPHMGSCGAGSREVPFPANNVALVAAWYDALGRRLGRAIDAADARRMQLREVRAALTGEAFTGTSREQAP